MLTNNLVFSIPWWGEVKEVYVHKKWVVGIRNENTCTVKNIETLKELGILGEILHISHNSEILCYRLVNYNNSKSTHVSFIDLRHSMLTGEWKVLFTFEDNGKCLKDYFFNDDRFLIRDKCVSYYYKYNKNGVEPCDEFASCMFKIPDKWLNEVKSLLSVFPKVIVNTIIFKYLNI